MKMLNFFHSIYNDRTHYAISVSAVFANSESPNANQIVPTIPNLTMPKANRFRFHIPIFIVLVMYIIETIW